MERSKNGTFLLGLVGLLTTKRYRNSPPCGAPPRRDLDDEEKEKVTARARGYEDPREFFSVDACAGRRHDRRGVLPETGHCPLQRLQNERIRQLVWREILRTQRRSLPPLFNSSFSLSFPPLPPSSPSLPFSAYPSLF